jgi:hypothetical protein
MINLPGSQRAGEVYRLVIYAARLRCALASLAYEEVRAVVALTAEQVIRGPQRRPTLASLLLEGASIVAGGGNVETDVRLHPIGTAAALAAVLPRLQPASDTHTGSMHWSNGGGGAAIGP